MIWERGAFVDFSKEFDIRTREGKQTADISETFKKKATFYFANELKVAEKTCEFSLRVNRRGNDWDTVGKITFDMS